jgi:hypothetical protein
LTAFGNKAMKSLSPEQRVQVIDAMKRQFASTSHATGITKRKSERPALRGFARAAMPPVPGRRLSVAETLRLYRRATDLDAAARHRRVTVIRNVSRGLERLEERAAMASARKTFCCRIHLVHPEKRLTGILVRESDKPTVEILPTSEDKERFSTGQSGVRDR